MKAETVIGPASIVDQDERPYVGIRFTTPFPGMFAVVTKEWKALKTHVRQTGTEAAGPLHYRGNGLRGNQALMKWAKETNIVFDPLDPGVNESYQCRYEAYWTDSAVEPRKLLWDVKLSIKVLP